MKKSLLLLFAAFATLAASAHDFEVNGIYYNITSPTTAEVTFKGDYHYSYDDEYSGSITIPATVTHEGVSYNGKTYSVTSIGERAFFECYHLTAITIPENSQLTSIGESAFSGCSNLTTITIPEGVTSIGWRAFFECYHLTAITIPENSQLTSIGDQAFWGCSSLTAINIPESVTSIGEWAFYGCSNLTAITIPEGVTSIGYEAFLECSSLTAITIPENSQLTSIEYHVFGGCSSLTTITLPEGVTSIMDHTFDGCSSLTAITIPEGVTSIGYAAFGDCSSLTAITIPENSQLTSIRDDAFRDCSSLTAITIPEGVTSIGNWAFWGCSSLTTITCHAVTPPTIDGSLTFEGVDKDIPVYVPASALNAYKSTWPWSRFGKFETFEITVENITLNQSTATLTKGETLALIATVAPDDATDKTVTWTSSDETVATVKNGVVTAVAEGTATITATASGKEATCVVTVEDSKDSEDPKDPEGSEDKEDPTGIEQVEAQGSTVVYDLMGRRVEKAEKGIYIVNGKKTVIK